MGRSFIGIELDPAYFTIAKKRIDSAERDEREGIASHCKRKDEGFDRLLGGK